MLIDPTVPSPYEDEAFNEIERQANQRKEAVLQSLHAENERLGLYKDTTKERLMAEINVLTELVQGLSIKIAEIEKTHVKRNDVLDEVTKEIEQLAIAFGVDTVHSFMMLIRSMKE